jgi:copper homeostasis protein
VRVEISVDTLAGAVAADALGADRIELCAAALDGGLTPSHGMVREAVRLCSRAAVHVLVRPRGGDFCYMAREIDAMAADVADAVALGAAGVVSGVLGPDGAVDRAAVAELVAAAGDREFTFHRAIDACADPVAAVEVLAGLGVRRVLTSGGAPTALAGAAVIAELVRRAGPVAVMAGGGVRPDNVAEVVGRTGVADVHAAPRRPVRGRRFGGVDFASTGVPEGFDRYELDEDVTAQLCGPWRASGAGGPGAKRPPA